MITVEHRAGKTKRIENYPAIGVSKADGTIILFSHEGCGISLDDAGEWSELWDMTQFVPLDGEITLRNA